MGATGGSADDSGQDTYYGKAENNDDNRTQVSGYLAQHLGVAVYLEGPMDQ